ncbi:leucine-rich repeat domain, L domain-like protein [Tanacetum coccineum]
MDATGVSRILSGGGLEYLNLSNANIMGDGLAAIGCPLLQEWNLSFCERIGIRGWESIGLYCKNLETLHVANSNITDAELLALGNGCKCLSLLYIGIRYYAPSFYKSKLQREDVEIKGGDVMLELPSWAFKSISDKSCSQNHLKRKEQGIFKDNSYLCMFDFNKCSSYSIFEFEFDLENFNGL